MVGALIREKAILISNVNDILGTKHLHNTLFPRKKQKTKNIENKIAKQKTKHQTPKQNKTKNQTSNTKTKQNAKINMINGSNYLRLYK